MGVYNIVYISSIFFKKINISILLKRPWNRVNSKKSDSSSAIYIFFNLINKIVYKINIYYSCLTLKLMDINIIYVILKY